MPKPRGHSHTTLTETAELVVHELKKYDGIKMIAPGIIDARRFGKRYITVVYTTAGFQLIISGTGVQKVAVHLTDKENASTIVRSLQKHKALESFSWNERTMLKS
jgi:hypothetical protein